MKLKLLPICTQNPRTTSFRVRSKDDMYRTTNSVYFDDSVETPDESWFTNSAESVSAASSSSDSALYEPSDDVEAVIRGAQQSANQRRLFFEPGESSALVGHVTVAVESEDPHVDFRKSMAEMVESLGVRGGDFDGLKELLGWYLKVNEESNHGYILAAFVDLISGFNKNDHSNDQNDDDDDDDDDDDESLAASFTSAAAVSLSSVASTAVSARLLLEDPDHAH